MHLPVHVVWAHLQAAASWSEVKMGGEGQLVDTATFQLTGDAIRIAPPAVDFAWP